MTFWPGGLSLLVQNRSKHARCPGIYALRKTFRATSVVVADVMKALNGAKGGRSSKQKMFPLSSKNHKISSKSSHLSSSVSNDALFRPLPVVKRTSYRCHRGVSLHITTRSGDLHGGRGVVLCVGF